MLRPALRAAPDIDDDPFLLREARGRRRVVVEPFFYKL